MIFVSTAKMKTIARTMLSPIAISIATNIVDPGDPCVEVE